MSLPRDGWSGTPGRVPLPPTSAALPRPPDKSGEEKRRPAAPGDLGPGGHTLLGTTGKSCGSRPHVPESLGPWVGASPRVPPLGMPGAGFERGPDGPRTSLLCPFVAPQPWRRLPRPAQDRARGPSAARPGEAGRGPGTLGPRAPGRRRQSRREILAPPWRPPRADGLAAGPVLGATRQNVRAAAPGGSGWRRRWWWSRARPERAEPAPRRHSGGSSFATHGARSTGGGEGALRAEGARCAGAGPPQVRSVRDRRRPRAGPPATLWVRPGPQGG